MNFHVTEKVFHPPRGAQFIEGEQLTTARTEALIWMRNNGIKPLMEGCISDCPEATPGEFAMVSPAGLNHGS